MDAKKGFDLSILDTVAGANAGFDVQIYHPSNNENLGITIHVIGRDSDEFKRVLWAQSKKRIAKMQKSGNRPGLFYPEDSERDGLELLAACTKSWSGVIVKGKTLECTPDNVIMVYEQFPWIREQVDAAIGDRANFIKA